MRWREGGFALPTTLGTSPCLSSFHLFASLPRFYSFLPRPPRGGGGFVDVVCPRIFPWLWSPIGVMLRCFVLFLALTLVDACMFLATLARGPFALPLWYGVATYIVSTTHTNHRGSLLPSFGTRGGRGADLHFRTRVPHFWLSFPLPLLLRGFVWAPRIAPSAALLCSACSLYVLVLGCNFPYSAAMGAIVGAGLCGI